MRCIQKAVWLTAAIVVTALTAGCASLHELSPAVECSLRRAASSFTGGVEVANETERSIVEDGLYCYLEAIVRRKPDFPMRELPEISTAEELKQSIVRTFGMTPMELGLEAFVQWERESRFDYGSPKRPMNEFETEHFILGYYPGTPAEEDLERVSYLCEKYLAKLLAFAAPEQPKKERFYANLARLERGRIPLLLPPDSRYWDRFNATAQMQFGFALDSGGRISIDMSIGVPYYNTLSSVVLVHEITHMVDLLLKLVPEDLEQNTTPKLVRKWWKEVFSGIFPHDTPLGEGFAEYTSYRFSLFQRWFLLSPEERLLVTEKRRRIREGILLSSPVASNRRVRLLQYTELHSLLNYLVQKYGEERFLDFYFEPPLTEERFTGAYGEGFAEIERQWRAWLKRLKIGSKDQLYSAWLRSSSGP